MKNSQEALTRIAHKVIDDLEGLDLEGTLLTLISLLAHVSVVGGIERDSIVEAFDDVYERKSNRLTPNLRRAQDDRIIN